MNKADPVEIYINATLNELEVDKAGMRLAELKKITDITIPRPFRFKKIISKCPLFCIFTIRILSVFWLPFILILILFQVIKILNYKARHSNNFDSIKLDTEVILATSRKISKVISKIDYEKRPFTWITVPWIKIDGIPNNESVINAYDLIKLYDIWKSVEYSIKSTLRFKELINVRTDILQTYTAFRWFVLWQALCRNKRFLRGIWFCNQHDRWAVLFDNINISGDKTIVQHGFVPKNINMPTKLKNISTIYYFNEESKILFIKNILVPKNINFIKLNASIKLSDITNSIGDGVKVLIIGQPYSVEKEKEIIERLISEFPFMKILVKPHPLYGSGIYKDLCNKYPVYLIKHSNLYPLVELALTSGSWLGVEYEASGVKVIWFEDLSVDEVISEISSSIKFERK